MGESSEAWNEFFDADYLYFHEAVFTEEVNDRQATAIWAMLALEPGTKVLDLGCGYGRISNRLAEAGCEVTGIDRSTFFLGLAAAEAEQKGLSVRYVQADMRVLPFENEFDCAICWFTTFGYFSDEENMLVLRSVHRALKPGGVFLLDHQNRDRSIQEGFRGACFRRGEDLMYDDVSLDLETGGSVIDRTIVRDGKTRRFKMLVRLFSAHEMMAWFRDAGFADVGCCDPKGEPFTLRSSRMIVAGRKPAKAVVDV